MSDVTEILSRMESGDPTGADELLPLVYEELRQLARQKLANELPGQTLQATALVHEAYLRLVGGKNPSSWDGRAHFLHRPPKPCGGFWWIKLAAEIPRNEVEIPNASA